MNPSALPLNPPQTAALAKVACGIEAGRVSLLCGPAGVGKTTVLERLASDPRLTREELPIRDVAGWLSTPDDMPRIVLADDAHLAGDQELAALLARASSCRPSAAVVLAGEGRLFTLVARDRRIEQAVRLRVSLLPGGLADTASLVASVTAPAGPGFEDAALVAIHEITGGVPGDIVRLTELAGMVAAGLADEVVTAADVEALHRRLTPQAA